MTIDASDKSRGTSGPPVSQAFGSKANFARRVLNCVPGAILAFVIVGLAFGLRHLPLFSVLSPMMIAIIIGTAFQNFLGTPAWAKAGIKFSQRRFLRLAIILLGLQLTASQVIQLGAAGLVIVVASLIATYFFTIWMGNFLKVEPRLSQLIAAGTSVCGASAVVAANAVVAAEDEDVTYAVACVTIFGSIAMFVYPLLPALLHLDSRAYGLWTGSSIHEIAQVVAASFQYGQAAGEVGAVAKLSRVIMLAPLVIALGVFVSRSRSDALQRGASPAMAKPPTPWFVLGFILLVGVNSLVAVPAEFKAYVALLTTFLLSAALAAMGMETDLAKLAAKGLRPALLGAFAFLFIGSFSLIAIKLLD